MAWSIVNARIGRHLLLVIGLSNCGLTCPVGSIIRVHTSGSGSPGICRLLESSRPWHLGRIKRLWSSRGHVLRSRLWSTILRLLWRVLKTIGPYRKISTGGGLIRILRVGALRAELSISRLGMTIAGILSVSCWLGKSRLARITSTCPYRLLTKRVSTSVWILYRRRCPEWSIHCRGRCLGRAVVLSGLMCLGCSVVGGCHCDVRSECIAPAWETHATYLCETNCLAVLRAISVSPAGDHAPSPIRGKCTSAIVRLKVA